MGACPFGAAPNSSGQAAQFAWVGLATAAASRLPEWTRLSPWIVGAIADRLVNVQELCNLNPDPPPVITPADFTALLDLQPGELVWTLPFMQKIEQALVYDTFQRLCNCTTANGVCAPTVQHISTATNATYQPASEGYWWPTTTTGISNNPQIINFYWPFACPTVDIMIDTDPHIPNLVINPFHIYDCAGVDHGKVCHAGDTVRATLSNCPGSSVDSGLHLLMCTFDNGGRPNWVVTITPVGNAGLGPSPPVQPPDTTTPIPTPPALHCDATGQCNVYWGVVNRTFVNTAITVNTSNQLQTAVPTTYVPGNSYQISGSGVQLVAQDTLGVVVEIVSVPPSLTPTPTDPPRYYDLGYLQIGAADALDGKRWIHSSGDRFIPVFPEMDRVHFNLTDGVVLTLVELVAPAPTITP